MYQGRSGGPTGRTPVGEYDQICEECQMVCEECECDDPLWMEEEQGAN